MVSVRRRLALALAIALVPLAACRAPQGSAPTPSCLERPGRPAEQPPAPAAPDGGQLHVTEQGFSRLPGHPFVVIGAMIENPTGHVAYDTTVTVTLHAQDGSIVSDPNSEQQKHVTIPVIMPGTQIGYAASIGHMSTVTGEVIPPAYITLEIGPSQWLPADPDEGTFTTPVVTEIKADILDVDRGTPYGGVTFTVSTGYCGDIANKGVATVFRNSDGAIVGGSFDTYAGPCPASPETVHVSLRLPPDADPSRATPYAYCDPLPR